MAYKVCQACGTRWDNDLSSRATATSYFFSSAEHPFGTYASAQAIIDADLEIITCPSDSPASRASEGATPSGASMQRNPGARTSAGDETHPSEQEL